ncbi:DUF317 domain-containing protein [Streptomyces liliiviolaceus]|uniref:DUF317 domain-containing protein n=1 Tax=Streptomyces liliiviolaceus TaxID=2823109 RepID=UPI001FFD6245|nr:DUF317 domain-containing protein [Streptomyces liliiviolaceus]
MRAELVHEPDPREAAWTFAAYETPVSDRMWHLTLTATTTDPLFQSLLTSLTHGEAWDTALGSSVTERTVPPLRGPSPKPAGSTPSTDATSAGPRRRRRAVRCPRRLDPVGRHRHRPPHLSHSRLPLHPRPAPDRPHRGPRPQQHPPDTNHPHRKNTGTTAPTHPPRAVGPAAAPAR